MNRKESDETVIYLMVSIYAEEREYKKNQKPNKILKENSSNKKGLN